MTETLLKLSAFAFVLVCFATVGQAQIVPNVPLGVAAFAVPVVDEGTAIEELERPNEVPPGSQEQATPENAAPPAPAAEHGPSDAEESEMKREFPSTDYPPDQPKP